MNSAHTPGFSFSCAFSSAETWSAAAQELEEGLRDLKLETGRQFLGFLYITDTMVEDFDLILSYLRQKLGIENWVGSVGMGIMAISGGISRERYGKAGAVAMIGDFSDSAFRVVPCLCESLEELDDGFREWMRRVKPPFGVVHCDPMNAAVPKLIESVGQEMENAVFEVPGFLVGGLTSSTGGQYQIANGLVSGGLSGALFSPDVEVATGLTQGCQLLGPMHMITDAAENVVMTLDGEAALNVLKADIGELPAQNLEQVATCCHAAFPVVGSDTCDYLVRNLMGIDFDRGWLAVGDTVAVGDRIGFVRRDRKIAEEDLTSMVQGLLARISGKARGTVYFSCVARGANIFGAEGRETQIIRSTLGDVPLAGFFGQGEISNNRIYGYTGVLTLFL
tara:strand:- start:2837 stop:4015 length:1179 start_codon:yes stop_codon:yes gene_type:complete